MVFLDSVHILNSYIVHFWKCSFPTFCNLNSNKNFLAFLHFTRDSKNILKAEIKPMFIIVVLLGVKIGSTNSQAGFKILNSVSISLSIFYLSVYYRLSHFWVWPECFQMLVEADGMLSGFMGWSCPNSGVTLSSDKAEQSTHYALPIL